MEIYAGEDQKKYHFLFMLSAKQCVVEPNNTLILKEIDKKILFMTARPGRSRAFIPADIFCNTWKNHLEIFTKQPPQIAIIHSDMKIDAHGRAKAIPIEINHPKQEGSFWRFQSHQIAQGSYRDIVLFFDWPAALVCPEPIQLLVPGLFRGEA